MPVLSVFSAAYCMSEQIYEKTVEELKLSSIDKELFNKASERFGISSDKLLRAMTGPSFVFNKFTHKREMYLAYLRVVLSELLDEDALALHGFATQLIPKNISHILRVCLLADPEHRAELLSKERGISAKDAMHLVRESDEERTQWTQYLFHASAWDQLLYDLKLPLHSVSDQEAQNLIVENFEKDAVQATRLSWIAVKDFQLAARVGLSLIEAGHIHSVTAHEGVVTVTVDEYVLRFEHLSDEIRRIASKDKEAKAVLVRTGPHYRPPSVFAKGDFDLPERVLLVDEEKDFVMTLSERLEMRDMEPAIAYDGEQALEVLKEEEPEVMILDLKMPGIDGIEVLRKVKTEHPEVEVVILTGHGDEKDRDVCMSLGAFAYLEKPVDMEVLSETLAQAKKIIHNRKRKQNQ